MNNTTHQNIEVAQHHFNLALASKSSRDYKSALMHFHNALVVSPLSFNDPKAWGSIFNAPSWFEMDDEHGVYLEYAEGVMDEIQSISKSISIELGSTLANAFINGAQFRHTTHNYRDLTPLMSRRASLFLLALKDVSAMMAYSFSTTVSKGGKIRYGILLKHLRQDPETIGALSYFEFARSQDVEVMVFVTGSDEHSGFADRVRSVVDRVVVLSNDLLDAVAILRQADLDLLFYANDVTAKLSMSAYLTFFRVARCAFTCVSSISTTASPYVDAYFGGEYFSQQGLNKEFSERFVSLPFPGFAFSIPIKTKIDPHQFNRKVLNLPGDAVVFTSGANFTKIHNSLLRSWARLLKQCPNAFLVMYPFPPHFGSAQSAYIKRWMNFFVSEGVDPGRVRVLGSLGSREAVIALLSCADIGLDSFPYSGLTTIVDAVEAYLPIVVPSGPVLRNNHAAAILQSVGLEELIARSTEDYIALAIKLANDPKRRFELRDRLSEAMLAKPNFLNPHAYCKSVVDACRALYEELKVMGKIKKNT